MFMRNKRYNLWAFLTVFGLLVFSIILPSVMPIIHQNNVRFIVDAGHGLPDGGAVGIDGTTEQFLNLQIAQKLNSFLPSEQTVMMRNNEQSLAIEEGSIREKKIADMKARVSIAGQYDNALLISIHMNTYPNSSVYGCQVFYKEDERSKALAQNLQKAINDRFQPNHTKQIKAIPKNLYLFQNISNSTILIECGFISNPDDLAKLKNETYQNELAKLISEIVLQ